LSQRKEDRGKRLKSGRASAVKANRGRPIAEKLLGKRLGRRRDGRMIPLSPMRRFQATGGDPGNAGILRVGKNRLMGER
jgi:hypothetical protein